MDRAEYWILNLAVRLSYPLDFYWYDLELLQLLTNNLVYEITSTELHTAIIRLFDKGLILASNEEVSEFIPSRDELEILLTRRAANYNKGLFEPYSVYYHLTSKGGECWEQYSKPYWNNFIDYSREYPDDSGLGFCEVVAGESQIIENYHLFILSNQGNFARTEVDLSSIKIDRITPWQVTYWKQLKIGYRILYQAQELEIKNLKLESRPEELEPIYDIKWYTNYLTGKLSS